MDGYSEYSVARFWRCKYFSHNLIDRNGETRVLGKGTDFYKEVVSTWERICIGTSCDLEFILSIQDYGRFMVKNMHHGK